MTFVNVVFSPHKKAEIGVLFPCHQSKNFAYLSRVAFLFVFLLTLKGTLLL